MFYMLFSILNVTDTMAVRNSRHSREAKLVRRNVTVFYNYLVIISASERLEAFKVRYES
jgi:hypothetical protein